MAFRLYDSWRVSGHLWGYRFLDPTLDNQILWARVLAPEETFSESDRVWDVLQRFTLRRIFALGSRAHILGIRALSLDTREEPSFSDFAKRAKAVTGWTIARCEGEVPPREFFALLASRTFPSVPKLRPLRAVFCGYEPDFWHEAVGHVAPLADKGASSFYEWCGKRVTALYAGGQTELAFEIQKILWVLLEYGFIVENGELKSFGAAITGSFMGLERLRRGYLSHAPFRCETVLESGLYEDGKPPKRTLGGKIRFFSFGSLGEARAEMERFVDTQK